MLCDTYVTMGDGTGVVHIAPAFGEDDARVCRKYGNMPFVQLVDGKGDMTADTPFAGLFVKDADPKVLQWPGRERTAFRRAQVRAQLSSLLEMRTRL